MARRLKVSGSTLQKIYQALTAIPYDPGTSNAIVSEGLKVIEQLRMFATLSRPMDRADIFVLHGRLNAVIDILHLLGKLPPALSHLAKPA
ncbi:MAG: hypothetical protein ABIP62_05615 [Vicinamibacteria bacterium]